MMRATRSPVDTRGGVRASQAPTAEHGDRRPVHGRLGRLCRGIARSLRVGGGSRRRRGDVLRRLAVLQAGAGDRPGRARLVAWLPGSRGWLAAATQFPGTLFFNATTFRALSESATSSQYDKVVWRPDFYGSVLFLVSSAFAILAVGTFLSWRPRSADWRIAWLNMIGSIAFMASAVGAYVLPKTGASVDLSLADRGTLAGAVCFFAGALLMIPAFDQATRGAEASSPPGAKQASQ